MASIVTAADGVTCQYFTAERRPVFIADARPSSAAGTAHLGHATLVGWLYPMIGATAPRAIVRTPDGRLHERADWSVVEATPTLSARRILPAPAVQRRQA